MKPDNFHVVLCVAVFVLFCSAAGCADRPQTLVAATEVGKLRVYSHQKGTFIMSDRIVKSETEWKKQLTPEQFRILRQKGTEQAGTGKYASSHEQGIYRCAGCGLDLFRSEDKYESGTGWPSFIVPVSSANIATTADNSLFSRRTEVLCSRCGGHLGHVFDDGPKPAGLRYCMNSAALDFLAAGK